MTTGATLSAAAEALRAAGAERVDVAVLARVAPDRALP
jgi:predicted amidophosphoribosyltransferase